MLERAVDLAIVLSMLAAAAADHGRALANRGDGPGTQGRSWGGLGGRVRAAAVRAAPYRARLRCSPRGSRARVGPIGLETWSHVLTALEPLRDARKVGRLLGWAALIWATGAGPGFWHHH